MVSGEQSWDVIVIGAGPAGSTVATLLAKEGRSVLVLEKDTFPRHHIGESLMPQTFWTFQRLGLLEKLKASNFVKKESVQFVSASGKDSAPYFFTDRDPAEHSSTWQVPRDRFDLMMRDNAIEHGATVRHGVQVRKVLMDEMGKAVGVQTEGVSGTEDLYSKVVVDASGINTLLSSQLGIRNSDPNLKKAAIYGYYKGAIRDQGRNEGATIIISTEDRKGWFWFIPLPNDVTSIGLVSDASNLFTGRGGDPLSIYEAEISECAGLGQRLANACRIDDVHVIRDFSYRSKQIAGDGWVLIGDAFGFLDPVYSSGVLLALKSGEMAADAINEGLETGDLSGNKLGAFGPQFNSGMQLLRKLVYAFYDKEFSFGMFMKEHPEYSDHLVRLLIGDVFNDEVGEIFGPMGEWTKLPETVAPPATSMT